MAKIKNNHFGNLSGKIGDLIYRTINGITYVSAKPEKVKISYSAKAIAGRRKFGLTALISGAMNRVFLINAVWEKAKIPGGPNYNKMMQVNYSRIGGNDDISGIQLFPADTSFIAFITGQAVEENILKLTMELSSGVSNVSQRVYPEISAHGIIRLRDNAAIEPKPTIFLPLSGSGVPFKKGIPLNFEFPLAGEDYKLFTSYPVKDFLISLVIKNKTGNARFFSENVCGTI